MELEQNVLKLSDICRTCLTCSENMTSLLEPSEETSQFIKKMWAVLNLEIIISADYPYSICDSCREKVNSCYEFQQLGLRSQQIIINSCLESTIGNVSAVEENVSDNKELVDVNIDSLCDVLSDNAQNVDSNNDTNESLGDKGDNSDDDNYEDDFPGDKEISRPRQGLKLKKIDAIKVERAIKETKAKFYSQIRCAVCNFQAANARALSLHMTRIHKDLKKSWCLSCNDFYPDLKKHTEQQHSDDLKCPFCPKAKLNMGHFIQHVTGHSGDKYQCPHCQKSYSSACELKLHKETHTRLFRCAKCSQLFSSRRSLQQHSNILRGDCQKEKEDMWVEKKKPAQLEPQNFCKSCNKKVRSLQIHIETYHTKEGYKEDYKKNLCPYCGKQFRVAAKLNVHIRVHTGETPYECRFCCKKARTRTSMVSHERTHTGEKPYVCSDCGKSFSQSSILNTHRKLHTGRPEQCLICQQKFCRPSELKIHMRKHTGEKPYHCQECNESFKQRSHLVDHVKTHNEKSYQCEYCDKTFRYNSSLKTHLHIHLGEKPYKCPQCPYACRHSFSLIKHVEQHIASKSVTDKTRYTCNLCQRNTKSVSHFIVHYNRYHGQIGIEDVPKAAESIPLYSEDVAESEEITDAKVVVNVDEVSFVDNVIVSTAETVMCSETMEIPNSGDVIVEDIYNNL